MLDQSSVSVTRRGVERAGIPVTVQRIVGVAPNATAIAVNLTAIVRNVQPDTEAPERLGYSSTQIGGLTQADRQIILMKQDLVDGGFPLPMAKGDHVIVMETSELITVSRVDSYKRAMAGAIEALATGDS